MKDVVTPDSGEKYFQHELTSKSTDLPDISDMSPPQ